LFWRVAVGWRGSILMLGGTWGRVRWAVAMELEVAAMAEGRKRGPYTSRVGVTKTNEFGV
jgi:hypothetical protein